jgi:hypothetical protein
MIVSGAFSAAFGSHLAFHGGDKVRGGRRRPPPLPPRVRSHAATKPSGLLGASGQASPLVLKRPRVARAGPSLAAARNGQKPWLAGCCSGWSRAVRSSSHALRVQAVRLSSRASRCCDRLSKVPLALVARKFRAHGDPRVRDGTLQVDEAGAAAAPPPPLRPLRPRRDAERVERDVYQTHNNKESLVVCTTRYSPITQKSNDRLHGSLFSTNAQLQGVWPQEHHTTREIGRRPFWPQEHRRTQKRIPPARPFGRRR